MRKLKLFIAMSLDGYIADENDSVSWLDEIEGLGDNGYKAFYNTVDTLIMGRRTYDWVMEHTEIYPYKGKMTYVLSTKEFVDSSDVKFVKDASTLIQKLKRQVGKDVWLVGGGKVVQELLKLHLVDEMIISVAPILLGGGIRLFSDTQVHLEQMSLKTFNQFTQIHYQIKE